MDGTKRFGQLMKSIKNVSQKGQISQLRDREKTNRSSERYMTRFHQEWSTYEWIQAEVSSRSWTQWAVGQKVTSIAEYFCLYKSVYIVNALECEMPVHTVTFRYPEGMNDDVISGVKQRFMKKKHVFS